MFAETTTFDHHKTKNNRIHNKKTKRRKTKERNQKNQKKIKNKFKEKHEHIKI